MIYNLIVSLSRGAKRRILLLADAVIVVVAFVLSWSLAQGAFPPLGAMPGAMKFVVPLVLASLSLSIAFGLHRVKLNAYEFHGMLGSSAIAVMLGFLGAVLNALPGQTLPEQTFVILAMTYAVLSVGFRVALRWALVQIYARHSDRKRVIVYGAGQTGQQFATALKTDHAFVAVAMVDDSPNLQGMKIAGLKVYPPARLPELIASELVDRVVLAMPSASPATRAAITRRIRSIGCEVQEVPSFAELLVEEHTSRKTVPVIVNELLGRATFKETLPEVNGAYHKRRVLVTGAGGSIGSELCRQLLRTAPECLVMLDHSEIALYNIDRELSSHDGPTRIVPVLGSVCNRALMRRIMREYQIDVVLHAAAYKHLPMVQANSSVGLANNVLGTQVVAEAALEAGISRFILISSDKAVRPTSVMGASKRMAEMVVQDLAARSDKTRFSMVRFGNVMGSSGSVLPLFQEQIAAGGPVTVTDMRTTRYFMTVAEAVSLVLLAGTYARGGEVFVLDMGKAVRIADLARKMIENAGFSVRDANNPDGDIEIVEIGMRPGEKLHEELLIGSDMLTTMHAKILRAQESCLSSGELAEMLTALRAAIEAADDAAAHAVISRWVETRREGNVTQLDEQPAFAPRPAPGDKSENRPSV